jgi:hypothetical protein
MAYVGATTSGRNLRRKHCLVCQMAVERCIRHQQARQGVSNHVYLHAALCLRPPTKVRRIEYTGHIEINLVFKIVEHARIQTSVVEYLDAYQADLEASKET